MSGRIRVRVGKQRHKGGVQFGIVDHMSANVKIGTVMLGAGIRCRFVGTVVGTGAATVINRPVLHSVPTRICMRRRLKRRNGGREQRVVRLFRTDQHGAHVVRQSTACFMRRYRLIVNSSASMIIIRAGDVVGGRTTR